MGRDLFRSLARSPELRGYFQAGTTPNPRRCSSRRQRSAWRCL
jgi:hypothetical protein